MSEARYLYAVSVMLVLACVNTVMLTICVVNTDYAGIAGFSVWTVITMVMSAVGLYDVLSRYGLADGLKVLGVFVALNTGVLVGLLYVIGVWGLGVFCLAVILMYAVVEKLCPEL